MSSTTNPGAITFQGVWVDQAARIAYWRCQIKNPTAITAGYFLAIPMHPNLLESSRTWTAAGTGVTGLVTSGTDIITMSGNIDPTGSIIVTGASSLVVPTSNPFSVSIVAHVSIETDNYSAFESFVLGNQNLTLLDRTKGYPNEEAVRALFFSVVPIEDQYALDMVENRALRLATLLGLVGLTEVSGVTFDNDTIQQALNGNWYADMVSMIDSTWVALTATNYVRAQTLLGWDDATETPYFIKTADAWAAWTPALTQSGAVTATLADNQFALDNGFIEGHAKMTLTANGTAANVPTITLPAAGLNLIEAIGYWTSGNSVGGVIRKIDATHAELVLGSTAAWHQLLSTNVLSLAVRYRPA